MRWMLWILDLDSIILIVILFFAQALFSPHSSHAMTDLSNACIPDLSLFTHALFVWLTNALINLISYHALHGVDKVSALLLPNVACHTAYSSHKCCLSSLFRLTFFRFHLFIIYLLLPLPGIFSSIIFISFYNATPTFLLLSTMLLLLLSFLPLIISYSPLFDCCSIP